MPMHYLSWLLLSLVLIGLGYAAVQWVRRRWKTTPTRDRNLQLFVMMFLVLTATAVLVNLVVSLYSGERAVLDQMRDNTRTLAHVVQEQTGSSFAAVEVALTLLANTEALKRPTAANRDNSNDLLAESVRHLSFVRAIWVLDAKGDMIRDSERLPGQYNLAERRYFQMQRTHRNLGVFIDRPTLSRRGIWFLPVSHRIEDAQGRFLGVVAAAVEPRHLRSYFDSLDVGKTGFVALMYEDGTLLHAPQGNSLKPGETLNPSPPFVDKVKHTSLGSYRYRHAWDNVDRIISYRRVGQRPLVIVVGLGVLEQLSSWQRTAGAYALASAVFLLAILILGTRLLREITRQRRQSARIADLNRRKDLLGGTNQLIVRTRSRRELLEGACQIAVEKGGFGLAWVEAIDRSRGELHTSSHAGEDADCVLAGDVIRYDDPNDSGLVTDCFLTGEATWINDLAQLPEVGAARWRRALACGFHSAIALPLKDGEDVHTALVLVDRRPALFDAEELKLLGTLARDLSFALEHISRREQIEYLGHYDALTGLPNRGLFLEHASRCLELAQQQQHLCAIVKFDIERFHKINEAAGWHSGDELLQVVGQRLKAALGDDTSAARTERDHFAFLVTDEQRLEGITHRVQHILHACFAEPVIIDGQVLRLSARAGVSMFPADGTSPERLMRNAEAALMHTKQASERLMFYAPEMNARVAESVALESRLRGALLREEFVLHYQPRYDAATGDMIGLEGLIRWNDPDVGLTYPGHFIGLLEETGLILDVGDWVMRKAIADYGRWRSMGLDPPRIAVNVSAMQLHQHDFYARVQRAIDTAEHTDHGLDVEITESMLIGHVEHSVDQLGRLREMGVCIAIDDFGTGYSSLQYLARLPLDALKIDRSFVIGMTENSTDHEIVSTVISLAHNLQLKVVAEGVETEQQAQMLREAHCDEMQGFLFAKPMPSERIEQMLSQLRAAPA